MGRQEYPPREQFDVCASRRAGADNIIPLFPRCQPSIRSWCIAGAEKTHPAGIGDHRGRPFESLCVTTCLDRRIKRWSVPSHVRRTRWCQVHGIAGSQADRRTGWPRLALTEQMRVVVRVSGAVGWFSYECRVWGSSFEAAAMPRFGPLQGQRCADSSRAAGRGLWVCVQ